MVGSLGLALVLAAWLCPPSPPFPKAFPAPSINSQGKPWALLPVPKPVPLLQSIPEDFATVVALKSNPSARKRSSPKASGSPHDPSACLAQGWDLPASPQTLLSKGKVNIEQQIND